MRQQIIFTALCVAAGCASAGSDSSDPGDPNNPENPGPGSGSNGTGSGSDTGPHVEPTFPSEHPKIYLGSQRQRLTDALAAHTPAADRLVYAVDEWMGGANYFAFPAWNAAILGQLTGNAAYCTAAIDKIETQVVAAEARASAGQAPEVARDSYLYIGEEIGDVVLTYDWCYDALSTSQRDRWIAYADQAVWNVWHHETASWGGETIPWTGWSVDNPSNNYYYSFLRATMFLGLATKGEHPHADEWIGKFRADKLEAQLVPTFEADLPGGGSREGTGYGQSMRKLFELYDFWQSTTGERIADMTGHTRDSMLFYMHTTMPTLDRTAPIGDHSRESTSAYFDYDRDYLIKLMALYPSDPLAGRVKGMLAASSVPEMDQEFMFGLDFIYERPAIQAEPMTGLNTAYYAPGTGVISARSDWSRSATWVGMIAGPYTESHAHMDQGSFMIFKNDWMSYDASHDTSSGVRQDLGMHSLVRVLRGGTEVNQHANTTSTVEALHQGAGWFHVAADLTPAYTGDSDVQNMQRELVFIAPDIIVVYDRVQTSGDVQQSWSLASPDAPSINGARATFGNLAVQRLAPANASSASYDFQAHNSDYRNGFRLDSTIGGGNNRFLHVMSAGVAVTATAIGDTGAQLSFGGRTATVTFDRDGIGGSLVLDGTTHALSASVDTLAE